MLPFQDPGAGGTGPALAMKQPPPVFIEKPDKTSDCSNASRRTAHEAPMPVAMSRLLESARPAMAPEAAHGGHEDR
jgi:hypothetical protein